MATLVVSGLSAEESLPALTLPVTSAVSASVALTVDVTARCMVALSLFVASPFVAADHGARSRADVLRLVLRGLEA